jgi:hypothetical protein
MREGDPPARPLVRGREAMNVQEVSIGFIPLGRSRVSAGSGRLGGDR